jgi:RHS repeat-associated protein
VGSASGNFGLNSSAVDEVAVYPSALSATQVANHFTASGWALPTTPTAVASWAGPASARVSWSSPTGSALSYIITPVANGTPESPISVPGTLTSAVIRGLTPGTSYKFQIVEHTQFGDSAPADPPVDPTSPLAATGEPTDIGVFAGYADGLRSGSFFPNPWPSTSNNDNGGILLTNTTGTNITVDSVTVTIGGYSATWGSAILVPSGSYAFAIGPDSSDINGVGNCTPSGLVPSIQVTVGGHTATYQDLAQVLNTGGWDKGSCPNLNEANKWQLLGGPPTDPELLPNPSENSINCPAGDPVNCATGNFSETFADLTIHGRGKPLAVTRTYNSLASGWDGPFGYGWSVNSGMYLAMDATIGTIEVHQETGSVVNFTPTPTGYQAPSRVLASLVHNADETFTFTRKDQTRFTFDWRGELIAESDRDGNTNALAYTNGQLSSITDPSGRTLTLTYTAGRVTQAADSAGRIVSYQYDNGGNLGQVTDVNGGVTKFSYDGNHLLLTKTDANGGVLTNVYDASGRVTSQTDPMSRTTTFQYQVGQTTVTDPRGNVTVSQYTNHEMVRKTAGFGTPLAATWNYAYDPVTLALTSITDPNSHVSTRTYDSRSNLLTSTDGLSRTTTYTYDDFNDVLTATDPMGVTTTFTYDSRGNLAEVSRPLLTTTQSQTTTYHHDDPSHPSDVTSATDPSGKTSTFTYDAYGDQISSLDPVGDKTTAAYNSLGWVTSRVSPRGNVSGCGCAAQYTTTYSYADPHSGVVNQFGDVRVVTDHLGHTTVDGYDANRNVVSQLDGNGNLTKYSYDVDNELVTVTRADGTTTSTDYNADGTVQDQKDGKGAAILIYSYDSLARRTSSKDALGNVTGYAYDGSGNLLNRTDPGGNCAANPSVGCTKYSYDAANQITVISYSDGVTPNVTGITYNADGQRTAMADATGNWSWQYDSLHRLTSVTEGNNGTLAYQYDLRNLVTQLTYPGGHAVTRGYDDAGRNTSTTDWLGNIVRFTYDAGSNVTSQTFPTNTAGIYDQDVFMFNANGQMSSTALTKNIPSLPAVTLWSASYSRDNNGHLTSDSSQLPTAGTYGYTPLNQLCYAGAPTSATCSSPPPAATAYSFDKAGNLVQNGRTEQAFNAADELCWSLSLATSPNTCGTTPTAATVYSYDSRGNRTTTTPSTGSATVLGYDQANRLTSRQQGSNSARYGYNGDGLRMSKTVNGTAETFQWDLTRSLPLLIGDGSTQYIYGPVGLPVEQINGSSVLYFHHDQLGSTRVLTDGNGLAQATYVYDAYGYLTVSTGSSVTNPLRYAGQYQDPENGFYYLRARYYDPTTAQFLSRDPLVASTHTPYAYARANSVNETDPSGADVVGGPWPTPTGGQYAYFFSTATQTEAYVAILSVGTLVVQVNTQGEYIFRYVAPSQLTNWVTEFGSETNAPGIASIFEGPFAIGSGQLKLTGTGYNNFIRFFGIFDFEIGLPFVASEFQATIEAQIPDPRWLAAIDSGGQLVADRGSSECQGATVV